MQLHLVRQTALLGIEGVGFCSTRMAMAAWLSAKFAVVFRSRSAKLASVERKLGLKRSNHVAGGLLIAVLRSGEEARLESPFSSSPRKSAGFSPPVWSVAPAFSSMESMLVGAVLRESAVVRLKV